MPDARKLKKIKEEIAKEAARRGQRAGGLWFSGNKAAQIAKKVGGVTPSAVKKIASGWVEGDAK